MEAAYLKRSWPGNITEARCLTIKAAALMAIAYQAAGYIHHSVVDTVSDWNGCHAI